MKKYFICAALFVIMFAAAIVGYNYLSENYTEEGLSVNVTSDVTISISEQTDISTINTVSTEQSIEQMQQENPAEKQLSENPESESKGTNYDANVSVSENIVAKTVHCELQTYDFTVYDPKGNPVSLSDFLGKPIIVNFWSTWCESCVDELPLFDKLYAEYGEQAAFLMINVPMDGAASDKVDSFINENGYAFPVYHDLEFSAADAYGVWAMPQSLFINKEGELVQNYNGELSEDKLRSYFDLIK
ncbi:MAG: TlpA family protein disulfide reductase [Eubacterium sp.]|nr:TlpA family protein disulfide reductase [Eubacterium sp.]